MNPHASINTSYNMLTHRDWAGVHAIYAVRRDAITASELKKAHQTVPRMVQR